MGLLIVLAALGVIAGLVRFLVRIEEDLGRCSQELESSFSSRTEI